jgi:hypothetical protein
MEKALVIAKLSSVLPFLLLDAVQDVGVALCYKRYEAELLSCPNRQIKTSPKFSIIQ